MSAKEIIERKRDGGEHPSEEIQYLISEFLAGGIKDYQMAAWLMAVYFRGLTSAELSALTSAMWRSGDSLPRANRHDYWIDKHSTGGVGDKPSLLLVPWVTSTSQRLFGKGRVRIPMISGRGLGHSGGTLDKLESVHGFSPRLALRDAAGLLEANDYFMMGQTDRLAPADRLLYALRDVTGTVECIPLIVASILSKKLSASLDGIVFDVKFGSGAFMTKRDDGRCLAETLVRVAKSHGLEAVALLSRMDEPLGHMVGNLLEIEECLAFLEGTDREAGLYEVTHRLATWMLHLASRKKLTLETAALELERELESSRPLVIFKAMFEAQGGRFDEYVKERASWRGELRNLSWKSRSQGRLVCIEPRRIGQLLNRLGGGRNAKEDTIDPRVGLQFHKKVGQAVEVGEPIVTVYHRHEGEETYIAKVLQESIQTGPEEAQVPRSWIAETILWNH